MFRLPRLAPLALVVAAATGCAEAHRPPADLPPHVRAVEAEPHAPSRHAQVPQAMDEPEAIEGVFHIVQPGQTLWRIARAYGVPLETIARANAIADPANVAAGTPVFIPGANVTLDVAPWPAPPPAPGAAPKYRAEPFTDLLWPVDGGALMRPFGEPRPHHTHAGIDIRGLPGQEILSARSGTVAFAGRTGGGYGNMVVVDHGGGVQTVYAHAKTLLVKAGDAVGRGERIALVGHTGNATADHCHFELRRADRPVDPMPFFMSLASASSR